MAKKRTTVWIEPDVMKRLKYMGLDHDKPVGDVIEALIDFAKSGQYIEDKVFRDRFEALLDTALANAGIEANRTS